MISDKNRPGWRLIENDYSRLFEKDKRRASLDSVRDSEPGSNLFFKRFYKISYFPQ
jgi:hypothetical protein